MRIVASDAVGRAEGLILMYLLQGRVFHVVAIDAKSRSRLGQVELVLQRRLGAGLVRRVAGVATHIEGGVTTALRGDVLALVMTGQAKIVFLLACRCLEQLILEIGGVRIVAGQAIANGRLVDCALDLRRILFRVTREAELIRGGRGQLDAGYVFIDPHFMAAQASGRDRRVNGLSFCLIFVALDALRRVDILIERNRVSLGKSGSNRKRKNVSRQPYKLRQDLPGG